MKLTAEQEAAVHTFDKNLIVVAGAGSGKTGVLTERYLQLLASNPDWPISALVAITFTREAAFEMRKRVREEIEKRAKGPDAERWLIRLSRMDSARIDTIHGLCADLVRANAAQAGVDPTFEVLDEIEATILLDEAVDDALSAIKPPVSELFAHYDAFKVEAALKQMALISAEYPPPADDVDIIMDRWLEQWQEAVAEEGQGLIDSAEADAVRAIAFLPVDDKLSDLVVQYKAALEQIAAEGADASTVFRTIQALHDDGAVGNKGSAKAWGNRAQKDKAAQALRNLRIRLQGALDAHGEPPGERDRLTARLLPHWHALLNQARLVYRERKRGAAQLDFDDLERLAAELLRNDEVRRRYRDAEFKQLLVDEFQDTNQAQWQIISSLVDMEAQTSLFVVGDPKQSIYQFRGADVSVFNRVRAQFSRQVAALELPLSMSFRSHHCLVEQFNALFAHVLTPEASGRAAEYDVVFDTPMRAFRRTPTEAPPIELQLLDTGVRDEETGDYRRGKRNRRQRYVADEMRRWEAYEVAMRIKTMIAEKRQIHDTESAEQRAIDFGDIAILFQSLSNVTVYEDVFKTQGIPYLTIAGRGYYNRQEVWDMLELLRFLHNPADELALATVLRSPIFAFSDDLLFALRLTPAGESGAPPPLWQALHAAAQAPFSGMIEADATVIAHALDTLVELRRISGRVTISELLRRALEKTNYLALLTGLPDGARKRGNIEKLLHLAEASGKITLGKFSQYLQDLSAREVREGEAHLEAGNAIRLMTVHASKGLEFPQVILADASWERGALGAPMLHVDEKSGLSCQVYDVESNKNESGFAHRRSSERQKKKELAERKRLLYVAATRARDYLLISGQVSLNKQGRFASKGWLKQLLAGFELDEIERKAEQCLDFAGTPIRVLMPAAPPPPVALYPSARARQDLWDFRANASEYPPYTPPLIGPVAATGQPSPRHITASQIADIGEYRQGHNHRQRQSAARRFRQSAVTASPSDIGALPLNRRAVSRRVIGEIVHELLRYGNFTSAEPTSDAVIRAVAWEKSVTQADAVSGALREVEALLALYASSEVCRWVNSARADMRPLFTELPFMFRRESCVVHGVVDLVLQQPDGRWAVIDYKTSAVADGAYERHADRYLLQLGVYAAALQEKLELHHLPRTYVHYIRGSRTVKLAAEDCLEELSKLEATLGDMLAYED